MKLELKNKWIEALESGKYEQGRYELRTKENKFCCLGVLCELVPEFVSETIFEGYRYWFNGDAMSSSLEREGLEFIDLSAEEQEAFMTYNDRDELSFVEIAVLARALIKETE